MQELIERQLKRLSNKFKENLSDDEDFVLENFLTEELKTKIENAIVVISEVEETVFDQDKFNIDYKSKLFKKLN